MAKMRTWIALFRGINVGGRNILPMKDLVQDLQSIRLERIKTYLQSGNAVFQSSLSDPAIIAHKISARIESSHGFKPQVSVMTCDDLKHAIDANPFAEAENEPSSLHCFFLASKPTNPDLKAIENAKSPTERFLLIDRLFYFHAPDGFGRSQLASNVEKWFGVGATARNWRTVQKLTELATKEEDQT